MTILKSSKDLTVKDIYHLTMNPNTSKMKEHIDERIEVAAWALYEDVNRKTGEVQEIMAVKTPDGESFATNSPTFINDFISMFELFESMGASVPAIVVTGGTSKAGREFITCVYSD